MNEQFILTPLFTELQNYSNWVVTRLAPGNKDIDKVPLTPRTGFRASHNNPSTWGTLEAAQAAIASHPELELVLGFVLSPECGLVCIDLDTYKTADPNVIELHKQIHDSFNKYLATASPCFLSMKGEVGLWMQTLTAKNAKSNEVGLRRLLLDIYNKSGKGEILRGCIYSDKTNNIPSVASPCATIIGDGTPNTFFKAIEEETIEDGFCPRWIVVLCPDVKPTDNDDRIHEPPSTLVNNLAAIARRCIRLAQVDEIVEVQETPEATAFQKNYKEECTAKTWGVDRDKPSSKVWNRNHLKLLRLGAVIAIGRNPDSVA